MFVAKLQRDGDEYFVEIPDHEIEAKGLSEGDWVESEYWMPTDEELASYLQEHPEIQESDS